MEIVYEIQSNFEKYYIGIRLNDKVIEFSFDDKPSKEKIQTAINKYLESQVIITEENL